MSISLDEVRHVARLARLELDDAEMLSLQGELNALLGHFSDIQAAELSGSVMNLERREIENRWAEDEPHLSLPRAEVLRNAPVSKAGLFLVPGIIED